MDRRVAWVLNAAGIAAPVLWLAAFFYSQTLRPEYNPSRQYISELAARGTSTQHLMQVTAFILPGLMIVAFGLLVGLPARTRRAGVEAALLPVRGVVDDAYYRAQIAAVDKRLALGGLRLAALLNDSLPAPPPR